jgi:hypothetical protein
MEYRIQFGESFDDLIEEKHQKSLGMNLVELAIASDNDKSMDIKKDLNGVAKLLNGKYATSRSAGNFLAGYNASTSSILGIYISFDTFQKIAGALHLEKGHKGLSKTDMALIWLTGTYNCSEPSLFKAPRWGEVPYQYRMSKLGWNFGKTK